MDYIETGFCKQLPKIELHAHLNGSLSASNLQKLGCSNEQISKYQMLGKHASEKTLDECFQLFKIAHNATSTVQSVYFATKYVIEEFLNDNVIYLELRTTPRKENNMTKMQYVESVIKGIQDSREGITTKLLLSIDRSHDLKTSQETMELIIRMREKYPNIIKGVDFSGNPNLGSFNSDLFKQAVDNCLFVTLHCAEVNNIAEIKEIISFGPNRIGHGTFLHPKYGGSCESWELYQTKNILLECCLTSNVLCGTVKGYEHHHLQEWIENSLPYSLCTDDQGIFGTCLSQELALAAKHFKLIKQNLWKMTLNSVDFSFASESEKIFLKKTLKDWKLKNHF